MDFRGFLDTYGRADASFREHCLFQLKGFLRRMVPRSYSPDECHWDATQSLDFALGELSCIPYFVPKIHFRAKALKDARLTSEEKNKVKCGWEGGCGRVIKFFF